MSKQQPQISKDVMGKIRSGDIKMKPSIYFTLLSAATIITSLVTGLIIAYLSSIAFFWLRIINSDTLALGARSKLNEALATFPWWAVILIIALLCAVVTLVRKYGTFYRHRPLTIMVIVLIISLVIGFGLSSVGIGGFNHSNYGQRHGQYGPWWKNN
jgi:glucan phosphoethanolaminetransferase (alkaline phosphatase superfamily)